MITKATLQDLPALASLINSAYRGKTSKNGWTTENQILAGQRTTERELTEIIFNTKNTFLKFTENEQIIGSVLFEEKDNELYLGMLTVLPDLQNRGIGKKMLVEAEKHAKSLKFTSIIMTVISVREELIAWYKRHGYVETGEKEAFPESDIHINITDKPLEFLYLKKQL